MWTNPWYGFFLFIFPSILMIILCLYLYETGKEQGRKSVPCDNAELKTDLLTLQESNISFNDIGGMEKLKAWIKKSYGGWTVEGKKFGLPLLKGLLLVGLPGCGYANVCNKRAVVHLCNGCALKTAATIVDLTKVKG
jgi:ATP-dependent Zn protease